MPRNGSGTYTRPQSDYIPGTTILATSVNSDLNDMAQALTASIARDGQTIPTGNLPMGGFRHTNVANAANRNEYAALGQAQDSSFVWGGTAGGTANALTVSLNPPITAYAAGQEFRFISGAAANTGAVTLNVNSLGALAINKFDGTVALSAGDIPANTMLVVAYDGTRFRLISPAQVRGYVQIQQQSVSAVANVDFTLPSGFRRFRLEIDRGRVATAAQSLALRCGTGGVFDAGATDYSYAFHTHTNTTAIQGNNSTSFIDMTGGLVANENRSSVVAEIDPGTVSEPFQAHIQAGIIENITPAFRAYHVFGARNGSASRDQIRILASAGANISGTFTLFGIAS
jgi:hypothetical protein